MAGKKPRSAGPDWRAADAAGQFALAVRHHQAGQIREAEQHYRQALAADPKHVDSLHLLGVLAHQVGRNDIAIDLIGQALALNDRVPEFHYNIGLAFGALGRFGEAATHNRRAVALRPDYADAHLNLGNALNAQGEHETAVASYQRALVLRPESPEAHYNIANALAEIGRTDDALAHYGQALALRPDYAEAHTNLGAALMAQGKVAEAAEHHRHALRLKPDLATALLNLGNALRAQGKLDEAIDSYRRARQSDPHKAETHNNLGAALVECDHLSEAAICFQQALDLRPGFTAAAVNLTKVLIGLGDLQRALRIAKNLQDAADTAETHALFFLCFRDPRSAPFAAAYRAQLIRALSEPWGNPRVLPGVAASVVKQNPAIRDCIARAVAASPRLPAAGELFGPSGLAPVAADGVLRALLASVQNTDIGLERFLTAARAALLDAATQPAVPDIGDGDELAFYCALARQCFINEYVFALSEREAGQARLLADSLAEAVAAGAPIPVPWLLAVAAYGPLHATSNAEALLDRSWPAPVRAVLIQQIAEPKEEARYRTGTPRLTEVSDPVSQAVRAQYEQNPYPRWTRMTPTSKPRAVDTYLRERFPLAPFRPLGKPAVDYLIAGCGTGQQVASAAQVFSGVNITAIDLSLASLGYAQRAAASLGLRDIAFGQADILELGTLGRGFDVIDSSGVLHHVSDRFAGWRVLLSILRPGGIMRVALYSTLARRHIAAARRHIAERGYQPTAEDIRRCRQDIMAMDEAAPERNTMKLPDFFSLSDCRDHLFHVQEHTLTIPQIAPFLAELDLTFLGFELDPDTVRRYAQRFPDDPARTNLDYWHAFEQDNPDTFIAMYEFWLQKRDAPIAGAVGP